MSEGGHARDIDTGSDEIILGVYDALALGVADHHSCVECDQGGSGIRRAHRDAAVCAENCMLAVDCGGGIRIADVSSRAVAWKSAAVVPAARVLRNISSDRPLVADLR